MDEVCVQCECELTADCCGSRAPYVMDEIAYCCEACAVDGECECGCIANPQQPTSSQGAAPGPTL